MCNSVQVRCRSSRLVVVVLVALLVVAGSLSGVVGVYHSLSRSQDFQWSGVRLLLHHVDPWQTFLAGDPGHTLIATQIPNYLPVLYVLLLPVGLISEHSAYLIWGLLNVSFAVLAAVFAARFYGLRGSLWAAGITGAMLAASPTRTSISNGQQGLLILLLWTLAFMYPSRRMGEVDQSRCSLLLIGISYLKYSFSPAIAVFILLRNGLRSGTRAFSWTLLPALVSTAAVFLWIHQPHDFGHLWQQALAPLHVAKSGYQPTGDGGQTFMDFIEFLAGGGPIARPRLTSEAFAAAIAMTVLVMWPALVYLRRTDQADSKVGTRWLLALVASTSFALYKHHPYDEVVFLYPLCYALSQWKRRSAAWVLLVIGYNWYLSRFVDGHMPWSFLWAGTRLLMFLALIGGIIAARPRSAYADIPSDRSETQPAAGSLDKPKLSAG